MDWNKDLSGLEAGWKWRLKLHFFLVYLSLTMNFSQVASLKFWTAEGQCRLI